MAAPTGVTARLIASEQVAAVVVTSDLGDWPTLKSVLLGTDADAATRAMAEFGASVGRLHAGTRGAGTGYRQALAGLGALPVRPPRGSARELGVFNDGMTVSTPAAMLAALHDPEQLQVFAALITATGPGRQQSWPDPPNTISVAYLTATGAAKRTGLSVPAAVRALNALE